MNVTEKSHRWIFFNHYPETHFLHCKINFRRFLYEVETRYLLFDEMKWSKQILSLKKINKNKNTIHIIEIIVVKLSLIVKSSLVQLKLENWGHLHLTETLVCCALLFLFAVSEVVLCVCKCTCKFTHHLWSDT